MMHGKLTLSIFHAQNKLYCSACTLSGSMLDFIPDLSAMITILVCVAADMLFSVCSGFVTKNSPIFSEDEFS